MKTTEITDEKSTFEEKLNLDKLRFEDLMIWNLINNTLYRGTVMPLLKSSHFGEHFSVEKAVYEVVKHLMSDNNTKNDDYNFIHIWLELKDSGLDESYLSEISKKFEVLKSMESIIKKSYSIETIFEKTEEWIKFRALKNAVFKAANLISDNDKKVTELPSLFTEALNIHIGDDDNKDISESIQERYYMRKDNTNKIPFLIKKFNMITKNGLPKKSLSCFVLATGCGKTAIFCSLAADYLRQGYNVLFITLELAKEIVETRIDSNITNISMDEIDQIDLQTYMEKCKEGYNGKGKIIVKEFPTSSVNTTAVTALLNELKQKKDFVPDILIVDYINLINPARKVDDSSYNQIKAVAEELRGICVKNNLVGITGTQVNREGIKNGEIDLTDTSESMGLPFTLDFMISGFSTKEQREDNLIVMKPTKNRFSGYVNNKIMLELDFNYMRLSDLPDGEDKVYNYSGSDGVISKRKKSESKIPSKSIKKTNEETFGNFRPMR